MILTALLSTRPHVSLRRRSALTASTAWLLTWSVPASAAPPARVRVVAEGACPAAADVARELGRSLPTAAISSDAELAGESAELVELVDLGDRYAVRAAGAERTLDEAARDCAERARVAAVFAAIALDPPLFAEPDPPATPPKREPVRAIAAAPPPALPESDRASPHAIPSEADVLAAWLSAGLLGTWASTASQPLALGPELAVGLAKGMLAARVTVAVTTPITLHFDDGDAEIVRMPASGSAYVRTRGDWGDAGVGLGLAVEALTISGRGDFTPQSETRVQVGARAAAYGRFILGERWGFFSELAGTFVPSTYDIELAPTGIVGSTPRVWLGLTLGVTMGLLSNTASATP